jgi:hypothetical protein
VEAGYRRAQLWRDLKERILQLVDGRQLVPVWIIDEAQNLPLEFFRDLPAFLNFAFDTRDVMSVWLIGHPGTGANTGAGRRMRRWPGAFRYACSSNRCSNASALRN